MGLVSAGLAAGGSFCIARLELSKVRSRTLSSVRKRDNVTHTHGELQGGLLRDTGVQGYKRRFVRDSSCSEAIYRRPPCCTRDSGAARSKSPARTAEHGMRTNSAKQAHCFLITNLRCGCCSNLRNTRHSSLQNRSRTRMCRCTNFGRSLLCIGYCLTSWHGWCKQQIVMCVTGRS